LTLHLLFAQLLDGFGILLMARESVEDEARAGRPSTFVTDSSVKRAEALIGEDPTNTKISRLGTWGKLRRCTHG
jgi:hypothetical protein